MQFGQIFGDPEMQESRSRRPQFRTQPNDEIALVGLQMLLRGVVQGILRGNWKSAGEMAGKCMDAAAAAAQRVD